MKKLILIGLCLQIPFVVACSPPVDELPEPSASAETEKPFYRGGFDDQIVEAPNGAKVNAQYQKFLSEGAFGGTEVVEVR
jgi:hypothetical protein